MKEMSWNKYKRNCNRENLYKSRNMKLRYKIRLMKDGISPIRYVRVK